MSHIKMLLTITIIFFCHPSYGGQSIEEIEVGPLPSPYKYFMITLPEKQIISGDDKGGKFKLAVPIDVQKKTSSYVSLNEPIRNYEGKNGLVTVSLAFSVDNQKNDNYYHAVLRSFKPLKKCELTTSISQYFRFKIEFHYEDDKLIDVFSFENKTTGQIIK